MAESTTYERIETPVLIIGAGAAGLRTAIELAQSGIRCLVLGKRRHGDAHTRWAAGGINASLGSLDAEDRWEIHAADTLREGHFVCDPRAVELLARHAPDRVRELQAWGCDFSRTEEGGINQRYFGAQSFRRTCFVGDRTGEAMLRTLVERARALEIPYRENTFVTRILVDDGRARGAVGFDMDTGRFLAFSAAAVVLAAAGHTALYRRSSSREDENTGDTVALACGAGAVLRDMEFVQFHPTGMIRPPEMRGRLVTEAVRGEGGRLFNASGERFMERYSPEQMELDARDVVARAIYEEIQAGRGTPGGGVRLDISHREADFIRERLPKIYGQFREQGIDITREPMEVAPTAHYAMGGVMVDFDTGATTVEGLFAVGEATAGVHGANRLGGNSLAETVVFGQITGAHLAGDLALTGTSVPPVGEDLVREEITALSRLAAADGEHEPRELVGELGVLLWDHAGIVRTEEGLGAGLATLQGVGRRARSLATAGTAGTEGLEWALNLRSMLLAAEMILRGALLRSESRGAHYRSDAPETRAEWRKSILYARNADDTLRLRTEPIPEPPSSVQAALDESHELDYHHLE
ncbi:MAG: FAD-binding protein [Gemmatimonadetes bacterium]|nr:FAD-binding protein [Gemmatimonadota bacterium]